MTNKQTLLTKQEKKDAKMWNRMAQKYSKQPIADMESYERKLAMTQKYIRATSKVFEFGCGTGGTALLHASYAHHIHAIDSSSKMIEVAKTKAKGVDNVTFEVAGIDKYNAPYPYDMVLGLNVLHLVPDKDATIKKVNQMLAPGGIFVTSTPCM